MNFSLDVNVEALQRRREIVALASRKIRAKKKQEREDLNSENAALREERTRLLAQIEALETKILNAPGDLRLELENQLLREQLEQHKGFLRGLFHTLERVEPDDMYSKGEVGLCCGLPLD